MPINEQAAPAGENYYFGCTLSSTTTREACGCRGCLMEIEDGHDAKPQPAAIDAAGEAICTRALGADAKSCGCQGCMEWEALNKIVHKS